MKEFIMSKIKQVFGETYELESMERLLGGAQKHTYLARCTNGFLLVVYQWKESTTYFSYDSKKELFRSSSAVLFEKNNKIMREHGVLTPKLYFIDRSRQEQDYDYAFVEYINGPDMEYLITHEPKRLPKAIESLNKSIHRLHQIKSSRVGQADRMQDEQFDLVAYSFEHMAKNCTYLKDKDTEYKREYEYAGNLAWKLMKRLLKRKEYTFIHAELGPNHVMVDQENHAYLIDIEGAKYGDVEEENSFLNFRFDHRLKGLTDVVEEERMLFYHILHCFSNLRGAMELKQKGYYDMEDVNQMITFFHQQFSELMVRV